VQHSAHLKMVGATVHFRTPLTVSYSNFANDLFASSCVSLTQGIDKNLAHCAMISKRVDADWWDMHAEVGLFLMGVGTSLILLALIGLIWWMVPR
jgi:hypothetical protein